MTKYDYQSQIVNDQIKLIIIKMFHEGLTNFSPYYKDDILTNYQLQNQNPHK